MLKFKNADSLPSTPKSWVSPLGRKILFNSSQEIFDSFVERVRQYCDANNIEAPSAAFLEDHICHQVSNWACIEESLYRSRQTKSKTHLLATPKVGCSSCVKRRTK